MHPALSVIFLTTLIGAGQGFFLALITGQFYSLVKLIPAQESEGFYAAGSFVVLLLLGLGLFASLFHLGRPERAWRAATKWRTSWLSREVIALPLFMLLVFLYGLAHFMGWNQPLFTLGEGIGIDLTVLIGIVASFIAFVLYVSTAMIYASVKFLEEWHHWLTVANYTLFGLASGFTLAAAFSAYQGVALVSFFGIWSVVFLLVAFITRSASLLRNARLKPRSTLQTAIGVRHNRLVQETQGFMGGSFNTREFFHGRSEKAMQRVRLLFMLLIFVVTPVLLAVSWGISSSLLPISALAVLYLGLLLERWYFFAEATHPQNLYYQSMA